MGTTFKKHVFPLVLLFIYIIVSGNCSKDEEELVRDLFRGYNKLIRPVQNMTEKLDVRFGLAFVQLINVNEKNQILKSNVWLRLVWNDYQLQWDEADYGGIAVLRLPPDKVWKPDIVLFNKMPSWIRSVFLNYLPAMLLMKRPRKTRLRWMMEMPGMGVPPHPYGSPGDIPKHISSVESQSKVEVMELSDLHHHPNCKINRKTNADIGVAVGGESCRRESESSDSILLSPEASKATEAVEFIAEHLRNEDLYIQTREDWKYVAMVIDRLQLYMFFIVTTAGTVGILMDAPHIFEYVDQDKIIEIYRGK